MRLRNIASGNVKRPVTCWLRTRLFNLDSKVINKIKQLKIKKLDLKDTNDKNMTGKIAWAHLKEFQDYYTGLLKWKKL